MYSEHRPRRGDVVIRGAWTQKVDERATHEEEANSPREFGRRRSSQRESSAFQPLVSGMQFRDSCPRPRPAATHQETWRDDRRGTRCIRPDYSTTPLPSSPSSPPLASSARVLFSISLLSLSRGALVCVRATPVTAVRTALGECDG